MRLAESDGICAPARQIACLTHEVKRVMLYFMKSTISTKGQVTVPAEIRAQFGPVPGTPVEFELRAEGILLRKGVSGIHPVDRVFGVLRLDGPVDEVIDEMRGPRPEAERG